MEKRGQLLLREKRRQRHHKIWCALRFLVSCDNLLCSHNFNDYRNNLKAYRQAVAYLEEEGVTKSDFVIAFRFCDVENKSGRCERGITQMEKEDALNWRSYDVNHVAILKQVLVLYQEYWDDVLASYKRQSARESRLKYLVENLEEVKSWPEIQDYTEIIEGVSHLQAYYSVFANINNP